MTSGIAGAELKNHDLQKENAVAADEALRSKFTNEELYNWTISQTSAVFFQTYKLAYDMAKRTERTYRFERGLTSSNFIQFGYWDSLRKGLLSGDRLYLDLKRLEMAYLEQNKREYEITKQISLLMHDPMALISLKETGQCYLRLPEALFDMDYPGHYLRRIKSGSLTIPCVTGPFTSVNCTLTLLKNKIRIKTSTADGYEEKLDEEDDRILTNFAALESIATSSAQNDSGLFEVNFRDERYLPFEGAGAVSDWRLDMPKGNNAFDFDTISDVIVHLRYTAREGGELLRRAAMAALEGWAQKAEGAPLSRLFSMRHEFPSAWHKFLYGTDPQDLSVEMTRDRFPFQFRSKKIEVSRVELFLKMRESPDLEPEKVGDVVKLDLAVVIENSEKVKESVTLTRDPALGDVHHGVKGIEIETSKPATWVIDETEEPDASPVLSSDTKKRFVENLLMICHYRVVPVDSIS